jgi:hypothetical protein
MGHLPFLFAVAGLALFSSGGRCQIPPAGHVISSRSEATYERSGARLSAFSNAVSVNVLAVYGPLVAPDGTTAVPGATVRAFAGGAAAFPYRLRNVGNAPDDFDLSIVYPAPCDFIPVGSRIFLDADADGVVDPGEAPVWNVGPLAPGEEVSLVVSAGVPAGLVGGEASHFALVARSIADTAACDRDNVVRIVVREEASISLALAADAVSALPGDTVGLAIGFSNPGERAATAVAIAAEIDAGGLCEGADFVPGSAVSTSGARLEYYDAAISSWTAAEPPAGRVKGVRALLDSVSAGGAGVFSYRLRVRDDRAEGWLRGRAGGSYLSGDGGAREIVSNEVFVRVGRISLIAIGPRGNPAAATGTADDRVVVSLTGRDAVCVFWHEILNGGNFDDSVSVAVVDSTALPAEWEIAFVDSTGAPLAHASRNGAVVGTVKPLRHATGKAVHVAGQIHRGGFAQVGNGCAPETVLRGHAGAPVERRLGVGFAVGAHAVQQRQRLVVAVEQPQLERIAELEGHLAVHAEQVLVHHRAHFLQPPEVIRRKKRPALEALFRRPVAVADVGNLRPFAGAPEAVEQGVVGHIDVPLDAVGGHCLGRLKTYRVHHPAKRVEQALGVALDLHGA